MVIYEILIWFCFYSVFFCPTRALEIDVKDISNGKFNTFCSMWCTAWAIIALKFESKELAWFFVLFRISQFFFVSCETFSLIHFIRLQVVPLSPSESINHLLRPRHKNHTKMVNSCRTPNSHRFCFIPVVTRFHCSSVSLCFFSNPNQRPTFNHINIH